MMKFSPILFLLAAVLSAGEPPGLTPVDDKLVIGPKLLLRDVGGWVIAPGDDFKWYMQPHPKAKVFMALNADTGERFLVRILPGLCPRNEEQRQRFLDAGFKNDRLELEQAGGKMLSQLRRAEVIPPHGTLQGSIQTANLNGTPISIHSYFIETGRDTIVGASFEEGDKPGAKFLSLMGSLKFEKVQPATTPDPGPCPMVVGYIIVCGAVGALVQFLGRVLFGKVLNGAKIALGLTIFLMSLKILLLTLLGHSDAAYRSGQEIGAAFFAIIIFLSASHYRKVEIKREMDKRMLAATPFDSKPEGEV